MNYLQNTSFNTSGQFAWDATSLKAFSTCPRYYYYMMIEGWEPKQKSVHLVFGGIYAAALEHYYKWRELDKLSHDEALIETVRYALVESWEHKLDEAGNRIAGTGHQKTFEHAYKTRDSLIRTIIWYLEEFLESDLETYVTAEGKPAVELSFKLPIEKDRILTGHIDRLAVMNKHIYVTDQKTTGSAVTQYFFNGFDLDIQMSNYTYAGSTIFSTPIKGVMIDAASISTEYTQFSRGFTHRSPSQLEEWIKQMHWQMDLADAFFLKFKENQSPAAYPMNLTACGNYGGCPYRSVCSSPPRIRENILKADYKKREPWDPMVER